MTRAEAMHRVEQTIRDLRGHICTAPPESPNFREYIPIQICRIIRWYESIIWLRGQVQQAADPAPPPASAGTP